MIAARLHPAARRELHRAFEWYVQEASSRIAAGFLDDFEHSLALLKTHPQIGETGRSMTRRLVFKSFPYTLVYRLKDTMAEIVAIAHHSRYPEYWAGRL
ncbi:MAG: type II toxin-antitoxin system RelE/ParE family toxin [Candidatus Dechloromonas phosphoritropha]